MQPSKSRHAQAAKPSAAMTTWRRGGTSSKAAGKACDVYLHLEDLKCAALAIAANVAAADAAHLSVLREGARV